MSILGYNIVPVQQPDPVSYLDLDEQQYRLSNGYKPRPLRLDADLPAGLEQLVNMLAENVHNVWADMRIRDGWSYGLVACAAMCPHWMGSSSPPPPFQPRHAPLSFFLVLGAAVSPL